MDYKNILIVAILCKLLVFGGSYAMDMPSGRLQLQGQLGAKEDPGAKVIYSEKDKGPICITLQEIAKQLRETESGHNLEMGNVYRQNLSELLPLLSKELPFRENKVNVLLEDLKNTRSNYGGMLGQAITEICQEKESIIEQAQSIVRNQALGVAEKRQQLEGLHANALSKKPKERLLSLLWEKDIKDLEAMADNLSGEFFGEIKDLFQKRQLTPLDDVLINIHGLKTIIYVADKREDNIKVLLDIQEKLKKIGLPGELLILDCTVRIDYMISILKMWQAFDEQNTQFDASDFATTILSIRAYINFLNSKDIEKIEELIKNPMFINFISHGFYTLDGKYQAVVSQSCQIIHDKIPGFPVPSIQLDKPEVVEVEDQEEPQAPVVPAPTQPVAQLVVQQPEVAADHVNRQVLQGNEPLQSVVQSQPLPSVQPPVEAPQPEIAVDPIDEQAPQGNQQQSFMAVALAAWNEFKTAIWASVRRILDFFRN